MKPRNQNDVAHIRDLLGIISRRWWYLTVPFLVILLSGLVLALTLPKTYQARALILVRGQNTAQNLAASPGPADIYGYVAAVSRQVMSPAHLEKTLNRFHLLADADHRRLSPQDKIALLRRRITIDAIKKDHRLPDVFFIAFKDKDPYRAMQVANALAQEVVAETLVARRERPPGPTAFLSGEQAAVKQKLEHYETALKEYRQKYMGGLPEQLDANLRALDRLQGQLMARRESLNEARIRLASVENLIAARKNLAEKQTRPAAAAESGGQSLEHLKAQLAELRTRYTEKHPDIVRLKMTIARIQTGQLPAADQKKSSSGERTKASDKTSTELASYLAQRGDINKQIQLLTEEIGRIQRQTLHHQQLVEETPRRQQELQALERRYDDARQTYSALLKKKLDAEMAATLQKKKPRQLFVLLDPATVPQMPAEPDLKKLFALTLAAALATGAGLVFLKEHADTSFRKAREVEPFLGVPLLAEVPALSRAAVHRKKKIHQALTYVSILLGVLFLSGFAVITFKGLDPVKTVIQKYMALQ